MTARPSRRRRWPWTLGVLGLGAVILVQTSGAVLRAEWTEQQVARAIEAALEHQTGERAVVGRLQILPSRARVELDGLVLSHRSDDPERAGATILAVDHIGVQLRPTQSGPWVGEVEIEHPVLRLHVDEDGLREFRSMGENTADSFPWSSLSLIDGTVVVDLPEGKVRAEGVTVSSVKDHDDRYDIWLDQVRWVQSGMDQRAVDVHFPMVQLTPDRLVMPKIDLSTEAMTVQGDFAAIVGGALGGSLSVELAMSALDALVPAPTRLEGDLHLDIGLSGTQAEPRAEGALLVRELRVHRLDHAGKPGQLEVEKVSVGWHATPGEVVVDRGTIDWGEGQLQVTARVDTETTEVEAAITLEGIDLAEALRQASGPKTAWTTFTGDGELSAKGTLKPLDVAGDFDLALMDLRVHTGPVAQPRTEQFLHIPRVRLNGDLALNGDGIRIHARDLVAGATSGEVNAWIGFEWFGPLDIDVDLRRASLPTFRPMKDLDLQGTGRLRGRISGPFAAVEFKADGAFENFSMIGVPFADRVQTQFSCLDRKTLMFTGIKALAGQTRYQGAVKVIVSPEPSLDIALDVTEGRLGDILGMVDADVGVLDGDVRGSIALKGDPYALDGDVALSLQSVDLLGERFAGGELYSWMDEGRATVEALSLTRWNGEEGVLIRGTVGAGWRTNLDVVATGFRLKRLDALSGQNLPVQGKLTVDARIGGTLFAPEPHGRVAVRDSWFAGHSVQDSTLFFDTEKGVTQIEGHLLGQGMDLSGHLELGGDQEYRVSASLTRFPLHTVLPAAVDGSPVEAWVSGEVVSSGALGGSDPVARVNARGTGLSFNWDNHQLRAKDPWTFHLDGKQLALKGFRLVGPGTNLRLEGETGKDGRVHWDGGGRMDLDLARIGVPDLQRADGGGYLRVYSGTPSEGLVVDLAVCGATVQGGWFPHPIEGIHGVIRATRDGYTIRGLEPEAKDAEWWAKAPGLRRCDAGLLSSPSVGATIGGGSAEIGGTIAAKRWVPRRFDLSGTLKDGRVAFFDFLPPAVGDAVLSFDGKVGDDLLLSGQIDIDEMMFSRRIEWEDWLLAMSDEWLDSSVSQDQKALFAMDLEIRANETVRMRNNVADLTASGTLRVVGDTARPGLVGDIRALPGGRIHLKEREFELERGELRFVEPLAYDPDLDIVLRTDVRTREQNYDVEYRVNGSYEAWRAETSSEPGLPSADINALLLFGMTRDELERYGGLGGILAVEGGDLLASKMLLSGRIGSDRGGLFRIVEPLRPDRLDLVSGVSERGSGILSSDLRLLYENELDDLHLPGTLMIFEQNLTRVSDTYLGLEQRLARTLFARSYWASEQHGRHLSIGGAYGLEMKLRWEMD